MRILASDFPRTRWAFLVLCSLAFLATPLCAKEKHWGEGISASIARPYQQVLPVIEEIARDGVIRGSSQYRGMDQLEGASLAKQSNAFPAWKGQGAVFFKVLQDAIAPTHFADSGEKGTVTVRYIVEPESANSTNIRIEAIYEEDSHHRSHRSDGDIETMEFVAISERFKVLEKAEKQHQQDLAQAQRQKQLEELQQEESREQEQLESVNNEASALQQKIDAIEKGRKFRVRTAADMQAAPFNKSQVLRPLQQGDVVIVLLQTPHWYKVQTDKGEQGWVYRLMLEVMQ